MPDSHPSPIPRARRVSLYLLFLLCGLLTFVVFSHFRPLLPRSLDLLGRAGTAVALLLCALICRRVERWRTVGQVCYAFFTACVATSLDLYLNVSHRLVGAMGAGLNTPAGLAIDKLESSLWIVLSIVVLTAIEGNRMASLYIRRGRIKRTLAIGGSAFVLAAATSIPLARLQFGARDLSVARILPWVPWILVFVLANAANEELLFRGLFLGKLGPLYSPFAANLLLAIPFTLHHTGVTYTPDALMFLAFLFPLSLAWGAITQKTGSLWGTVLFHAGMDIPVVLGIFSTLPYIGP